VVSLVIETVGLSKKFRRKVKPPGLSGSIRALLRPEYREVEAVSGINLQVERGEILAFIGPNGAGKSTTIKMLTGILQPSGGRASVLDFDPSRDRQKLAFHIGSVFGQKTQLWFHLPPADSFRLLGAIYELPEQIYRRRLGELVERFGLRELMDVPVRKLSLGQRIRCEIAASLLHHPEILFLDEPTIGLDVIVKQQIRDLIKELNREEKTTIFLTSHDVGDIERLCHRAIIINNGRIVLNESMKNLKYSYFHKKTISVKYRHRVVIDLPGVCAIKEKDLAAGGGTTAAYAAKVEVDTEKRPLQQVVSELMGLGEVLDINISDQPLEEIIAEIYKRQGVKDNGNSPVHANP
jgi:ABC-2 type transport system ATP-binding protein